MWTRQEHSAEQVRCCIAARQKEAALIHSAGSFDLSVQLVEVHFVRRGSCVPSAEWDSKVRIVPIKVRQDGATRNFLKGRSGIKGSKGTRAIGLCQVLYGLHHLVGSTRAPHTLL